jgi:hypothetical protein
MVSLSATRRASPGDAMAMLARFGLAARAFIYVVIGVLAIEIALGHRGQEADQRGALAAVAHHPYGVDLVWVLGIGFAAYALWRLSEAVFGTAADGDKAGPRTKSLVRGIVYGVIAASTFAFIAGTSRQGQAQQQETLTSRVMKGQPGRWLVGLIGLIVVAVGAAMVVEGLTRKLEKQLQLDRAKPATRRAVIALGAIGTTARGVVFAIAGVLVIDASITYDPSKSSGLDGALRTLADRPYGPWLLELLAVGVIVFGIYGFAAARWTKI